MPSASAAQKALQQTATFAFTPFVARLLGDGMVMAPKSATPLPVGDAKALTAEVVGAVEDMAARGVWAWLWQSGGWRATPYADPRRDDPRQGRIFDSPAVRAAPLRFSVASITRLILTYNLVLTKTQKESAAEIARLGMLAREANGDLLLEHLLFLRLRERRPNDQAALAQAAVNPLTRLIAPEWAELPEEETLRESLERLLEPDVVCYLPWLGLDVARRWLAMEERRWRDREAHFQPVSNAQGAVFCAWAGLCRERQQWHLLAPFLYYFRALLSEYPAANLIARFQETMQGVRLGERETVAAGYFRVLGVALAMADCARAIRARHPADRDAAGKIFLSLYAATDFEQTAAELESLLRNLQPKLS